MIIFNNVFNPGLHYDVAGYTGAWGTGIGEGWTDVEGQYPNKKKKTREYIPQYFTQKPLSPYANALLGKAFTTLYGEETPTKEYQTKEAVTPWWSWPSEGETVYGPEPPMVKEPYYVEEKGLDVLKYKDVPIAGTEQIREAAPAEWGMTAQVTPSMPSSQLWRQMAPEQLQPMFTEYMTNVLGMAQESFMQAMQSLWPSAQKQKPPEWRTVKQR